MGQIIMRNWDLWQLCVQVVLATGPNSQFDFRSGSNPELDRCNRFYHTKTWTFAIGLVLPPKTRHFNVATLAPIKYLSSDGIVTWSVRRLYIITRTISSYIQNWDGTKILCVAIKNPGISHLTCHHFTATQRMLVASQFWIQKVNELPKLYNLHTDLVMIWSEPKYLMSAKVLPML